MVFPVVIYECESWTIKKAELWRVDFWTMVTEKTLESPLDSKQIQPVHPKGNQSWIFIGRTDAQAPKLWPPLVKNWLTRKDPDAGKDWRWDEKRMTEDEMVGWHHWLNGHVCVSSRNWWWTGKPGVLQSVRSQSQTQLSDWTELKLTQSQCVRLIFFLILLIIALTK